MTSWHNYPSIFNLGHAAIGELLLDPVVIEEKIDGSQFSFGQFEGELRFRSKRQEIHLDLDGNVPVGARMFEAGIKSLIERGPFLLREGWTYRGEYLNSPRHNTLAYDRVPNGNIIIFDINTDEETYLDHTARRLEAERIGFEAIPVLFSGHWQAGDVSGIEALLETRSILGGQKIEGIVIKNYFRFGKDKKVLMGKYVSEAFKEVHSGAWKERNPNKEEFIAMLVNQYRSPARWTKAVQHLREDGRLEGSPRDISSLVKEIPDDLLKEYGETIRQELFDHFWAAIRRGVVRGVAEWYKNELLRQQFAEPMTEVDMIDPRPRLPVAA